MTIQIVLLNNLKNKENSFNIREDVIILNNNAKCDSEMIFRLQQFYKYCMKYGVSDVEAFIKKCIPSHPLAVYAYIPALLSNPGKFCYINNKKSFLYEKIRSSDVLYSIGNDNDAISNLIKFQCNHMWDICAAVGDCISQIQYLERKGNIKSPVVDQSTSRLYTRAVVNVWNTLEQKSNRYVVPKGRLFDLFVQIFDSFLSISGCNCIDDTPVNSLNEYALSCFDVAVQSTYCVDAGVDCTSYVGYEENILDIMEKIGFNTVFVDISNYIATFILTKSQRGDLRMLYCVLLMIPDYTNGKALPSLVVTAVARLFKINQNPFSIPENIIEMYLDIVRIKLIGVRNLIDDQKLESGSVSTLIDRILDYTMDATFPVLELAYYSVEKHYSVENNTVYPIYDHTEVDNICEIGCGTYGSVCKVVLGGNNFACKKFTVVGEHAFISEISYLTELSGCDYILKVKGLIRKDNIVSGLLVEMADFDIYTAYKQDTLRFQNMADELIAQLLVAVSWMHSRSISHCDIKPSNILWFEDQQRLKLCDFGISGNNFITGIDRKRNWTAFTFDYRPPEMFISPGHYHTSGDMWSVGCMAYYFCTGTELMKGVYEKRDNDLDVLLFIAKITGTDSISDNKMLKDKFEDIKLYKNGSLPKKFNKKKISDTEYTVLCQKVMLGCVKMNPDARSRACDFIK